MKRLRALRPGTLRAAWWAWRALTRARGGLRSRSLDEIRLPPAPRTRPADDYGVAVVLNRRHAKCLEAALVRQALFNARGTRRELLIGIVGPADGFRAHAWLDGDAVDDEFVELARYPSP